MAVTTRAVRSLLLGAGLLLAAVILGFLLYAHYLARQSMLKLPGRIGADIRQETNGFTYSQSLAGRTVFTVHAAREIQRTNGRITLHDVSITLYGSAPGEADHISGSEFEYDPAAGVLSAAGQVFLDLQAPAGSVPDHPGRDEQAARTIHVQTSGLTFLEKQREASTEQPIAFSGGGVKGSAIGASYSSSAGLFRLGRAVRLEGMRGGHPLALTAGHAEFDRTSSQIRLQSASARQRTATGDQTFSAQRAVLTLSGGAPADLHAEGDVVLSGAAEGTFTGDRLDGRFSNNKQGTVMHHVRLSGHVRLVRDLDGDAERGRAADLDLTFNPDGRASHVTLSGAVNLSSQQKATVRTLSAARVEIALAAAGKTLAPTTGEAFGADATAPARLEVAQSGPKGSTLTAVSAFHLHAQFTGAGKAFSVERVAGEQETRVEQRTADLKGRTLTDQVSRADALNADFRRNGQGRMVLARAEQQGHFTADRQIAASTAGGRTHPAATEHARAESATFDAAEDKLLLAGGVQVEDATGTLFADRMEFSRASGDATAAGAVRASYLAPGSGQQPLHITAARAQANRASGMVDFFGSGSGTSAETRLWQGGSQLMAAQIRFDRKAQQVIAQGGANEAHAVIGSDTGAHQTSGLLRVAAQKLVYSAVTHRIDLEGAVQLAQAGAGLKSSEATILLAPSGEPAAAQPATAGTGAGSEHGLGADRIERITARGALQLRQPGRLAEGDRLVYTAADQTYVLTGTSATPPRLIDREHGTITGASLRFHGGDDSVEILGGVGGRVQSQTTVKSRPKGK